MEARAQDIQEVQRIYSSLFHKEVDSLSTFSGGTSNLVFLVDEHIVIRLKRSGDPNFYRPKDEHDTFLAASNKDLAPHLIAFNYETASCVYDLANGTHFLTPRSDERTLMKLGMAIKLLHNLPATTTPFNAPRRLYVYKTISHVRLLNSEEEQIKKMVEPWLTIERKTYSHNDLVLGNIITESPTSPLRFLDFEFAGPNVEMWDLASVLSENGIEGKNQQEALLRGYFGKRYEPKLFHKCHSLMLYQDYLWYYWAYAKYRETGNEVYKEIVDGKFKNLTLHRIATF